MKGTTGRPITHQRGDILVSATQQKVACNAASTSYHVARPNGEDEPCRERLNWRTCRLWVPAVTGFCASRRDKDVAQAPDA